jgi:hypothetical protein
MTKKPRSAISATDLRDEVNEENELNVDPMRFHAN